MAERMSQHDIRSYRRFLCDRIQELEEHHQSHGRQLESSRKSQEWIQRDIEVAEAKRRSVADEKKRCIEDLEKRKTPQQRVLALINFC